MLDMDFTLNGTRCFPQFTCHNIGFLHQYRALWTEHSSFHYPHHASLQTILISHINQHCYTYCTDTITHNFIPLCIHHHSQLNILHQTHSIQYLLHGFLIIQHVVAYWIGCLFEHMPYSTVHLSMNTSSLITECLSQDRIDKLTPGYHSIIKHAHDYTP